MKEEAGIFSISDIVEYSSGSVVSKSFLKKPGGNISFFAFDKGEGLSEHTTPHEALIQIIDGAATISINKIPYQLSQGQCILLPANIPHAVFAEEKFKMMLVMIKVSEK